jgi:protein O-mannosyl-transferase
MKQPEASAANRMIRRSPAAKPPTGSDLSGEPEESPISKTVLALICLVLVIAIIAIYSRTFGYGFVAYDDDKYVYENPVIKAGLTAANLAWAFRTFYFANWYPLTWVSYLTDIQFFGLNAGEMHAVNVLLHLLAALLLFLALLRLTRQPWRCALVAGLFALHPLNVQSVAWISDRKDVLSAFFAALTLLLYAGYARKPSFLRYLFVALAFAMSLMAKTMAVTLPFVLLLLDFWPLRRLGRLALLEKTPLFAMAAIGSILTFLAQRDYGAAVVLQHIPFSARAANAIVSFVSYIEKAVWPAGLAAYYPSHAHSLLSTLGATVILLAVTAAAIKCARQYPYFLTGWLWYLGMLVPVIGIVPQVGDQAMADRYAYLPMVGVYIAVIWTAAEALSSGVGLLARASAKRVFPLTAMPRAAAVLSVIWLATLAVAAARQVSYWADSRTLFEHALAVTDGNYVMANNLGVILAKQPGQSAQAIALYRQSLAWAPFHASAHANLGSELAKSGEWEQARKYLETAVRLDPGIAAAQANLGLVLAAAGDYPDAQRRLEESLRLDPEQAEPQNNMCGVLLRLGRPNEAAAHCTEALQLRPTYAKARTNLARALALQGRKAEAERQLNLALHDSPNDAAIRQALLDLHD